MDSDAANLATLGGSHRDSSHMFICILRITTQEHRKTPASYFNPNVTIKHTHANKSINKNKFNTASIPKTELKCSFFGCDVNICTTCVVPVSLTSCTSHTLQNQHQSASAVTVRGLGGFQFHCVLVHSPRRSISTTSRPNNKTRDQ